MDISSIFNPRYFLMFIIIPVSKQTSFQSVFYYNFQVQFSLITQLCPTLCNPMNHSMPGLPVHHQLPELAQSLIFIESVMPYNHLILCCPLLLLPSIFPGSRSFPRNHFFTSGGQSIGVSASASVLPMNIQD